ncbi:hypothetical protein BSL78_20120 [Apostichopus japonicus]|uniref:Ubiquitin-like domain-containing protein n=1 Tax=Stichopus japonicus TaxID=307972 RepID=A0A2G8K4Z7_STIJA|nr:hypothetical protein BSL78_20120 [Apostichopus japonicus]
MKKTRNRTGDKGTGKGLGGYRGKFFDLRIQLFNQEIFRLHDVFNDMKVRAVKAKVEFVTGIPSHLQRLTYLDGADMMDNSDLKHHDMVPGAIVNLDIWHTWKPLVDAAAMGNVAEVLKLGVTQDTEYSTPSSKIMKPQVRNEWIAERAFVALCIAAHRGHVMLVQRLIEGGADVKAKTPNGRTALHIAGAQGMNSAVEVLLNNGSVIEDPDNDGKTPLVLAGLWGHKSCERQIFLFQWQQRAAKHKPVEDKGGRLAHQMFDSKLKTWLEGPYAQMYYSQIVPPGEFTGTSLSAPRRRHRPSSAPSDDRRSVASAASSERYFELVDGKECGVQVRLGVESLKMYPHCGSKKQTKGYSAKSGKDPKATFDDWLARKKNSEKQVMDKKKKVEKEKKQKRDEEDRETQNQQKSFDAWLKEQKTTGSKNRGLASGSRSRSAALQTPDEKSFDLWKIRKEMDILHPIHIGN